MPDERGKSAAEIWGDVFFAAHLCCSGSSAAPAAPGEVSSHLLPCTHTNRELISTTAPMEGQPQCLLHHAMPCASFCSNQPFGRPCPTLSREPSCDEDKPPASQHRREPSTCPPGRKSLQKHPRADGEPLRWVVPVSIRQRA